jgi:hypothetical protein
MWVALVLVVNATNALGHQYRRYYRRETNWDVSSIQCRGHHPQIGQLPLDYHEQMRHGPGGPFFFVLLSEITVV